MSPELQELANKLYAAHPALGLNTTPYYYHWSPGMHPNIARMINDPLKFKKKILLPHCHNINFVGLLIGPKGLYQKKLEDESGCKILIRGKYIYLLLTFHIVETSGSNQTRLVLTNVHSKMI